MILTLLMLTFVAFVNCFSGVKVIQSNDALLRDDTQLGVWPQPQQYTSSIEYYTIEPKAFNFYVKTKGQCDILDIMVKQYEENLFLNDCSRLGSKKPPYVNPRNVEGSAGRLMNVTIIVNDKCESIPRMFMNENYSLSIDENGGTLMSASVWGALRGLETFSQLIQYVGNDVFIINKTVIMDFPRFSHRGMMLDTSRHYVPMHVLLENLDAMTYNKLNVFHWHIVDDQSFPYVSKRFPNLSKKGAYNPHTHIYTPEEIQTVIEYARVRGIRVLIEFDTPGHTLSWGKGQPGLLTPCYTGEKPNGNYGPIDPINEENYAFIKDLFTEVTETFPDEYFHVGGDEVDFGCWKSNPNITNWMKVMKIVGNYSKLEQYYVQKVLDIVKGLNRSYIVWQEVFDNNVVIKPDTVVHVWKDKWQSEMHNVTSAGFNTLLSTCWYLNYISYGTDWINYYKCDPQNFNGTDAQKNLVQGGEACMWGEWVDGTNLISRTWPRAIAVAERLWSSKDLVNPNEANGRFNVQHCRMLQRGLRVQPANGPGFCQCDYAV